MRRLAQEPNERRKVGSLVDGLARQDEIHLLSQVERLPPAGVKLQDDVALTQERSEAVQASGGEGEGGVFVRVVVVVVVGEDVVCRRDGRSRSGSADVYSCYRRGVVGRGKRRVRFWRSEEVSESEKDVGKSDL